MVEILGPVPARPPTPPRPGSRTEQSDSQSARLLQTPGSSSQPADASRAPPSSHGSKRVNFSPWLYTVIGSPTSNSTSKSQQANSSKTTLENLPNSGGKPFKSILKETSSPIPVWSPNVNKFTVESIDMLLESVVQQLAGQSVPSRLDAYMSFFSALRTYDELPSGKEIGEKLSLITEFIQRDVTRDLVNGTPMDTSLVNQALKLCAAFVWQSDISTQLPEDFKVFLVEQAIVTLQETKCSKSVVAHYLSILSTQNFSPKIMTSSRVIRILTALQDLTKHVTGKAISVTRLSIYQRLLFQAKSTFLSHSSLWMENLVFGLLQPQKDTRVKAISLGFQISVVAGPSHALSANIRMLFERPLEGDRRLVNEALERMSRMVGSAETGLHVPQIWSIVVLLLRSKKWSIDQWEHFKDWLLVLQKCFNCSDHAIKSQAIEGWNRFIYAMSPNETTSRSILKMLAKPVLSQFERKKSDKPGPPPPLALSSYYHLLYYAFRPSLPHRHIDVVWEEYVAAPSMTTFSAFPALSDSAALVLANLLWSPQAKVWTETRVTNNAKLEVDELPSVDPRWVRSKISSVLGVFESLLKSSIWNQEAIEKSNIALAWRNLASALSLASSKEITPSGESMQAVACVLSMLHRVWTTGLSSLNATGLHAQDAFFQRFQFLSTTMILSLGAVPFTEKLMLRTGNGSFQTTNTPTHRPSASGNNLDSPLMHILRTISKTSVIDSPSSSYGNLINGLITASCNGRISRGSRLELLHQCAGLSTAESKSSTMPQLLGVIWKESAREAAKALQSFPIEPSRERDGSASRDYEIITSMLQAGVLCLSASQDWSRLLEAYVRVVRTEKGDQALTNLVVEPIAKTLSSVDVQHTYMPTSALLGHCLSIPFGLGSGVGIDNPESSQIDPLVFPRNLVDTLSRSLVLGYNSFSALHTLHLSTFIESLTSFLSSGSPTFRSHALDALQAALGLWIQDSECKIDGSHGVDSRTITACRALSSAVLNILQTAVFDELSSLERFETIICAGLKSRAHSQVKRFVDFWESTKAASNDLSPTTTMGQAFSSAASTLSAQVPQPQSAVQGTDSAALDPPKLAHDHSKDHIPAKDMGNGTAIPHSSPGPATNDLLLLNSAELNDPQLPTNAEATAPEVPAVFQRSRREMFRMIESIRSSSPANTPGKLGFDTPVHLRRLHSQSGIPLTPTLVATENDDGFIGSSPTPATRDPTPAMNLNVSGGRYQVDVAMEDVTDLPSSPPEVTSRSPSPKKLSSSSRRAKRRKLLQSKLSEEARKKTPTPQVDERPPSGRTRSALTQSSANNQIADAIPDSIEASETPANILENSASSRGSKSKSSSKKRKKKGPSKRVDGPREQSVQVASTPVTLDCSIDSSSEDLESQIASQLEQDLELAADMVSKEPLLSPAAPEAQETMAKKRKREEDSIQPTTSDRRRSTRLSTAKDMATTGVDETQSVRSQGATTSQSSQDISSSHLSPTITRRMTRSSQKKDAELAVADSFPETEIQETVQQEPGNEVEPSQRPTKRSRKSLRLEDESAGPMEEQDPNQSKSSRSSRSRKSRSSRNDTPSQSEPSQAHLEEETATIRFELPSASDDHAIPDVLASQKPVEAESHVPFVSTEEATDSQNTTHGDLSTPPVSAELGLQQNMDVDVVPDQRTSHVAGLVLDVATAEIQTEPVPPALESDTSETGISRSLQRLLADMKSAKLGPNALREVDDLLFNIRIEAHEASRRHNNPA